MATTKKCTSKSRAGRLDKAKQFLAAAEMITPITEGIDLADAFVTLCVHAGIAASDVICCARLNEHSIGGNHNSAIALLARVDKGHAIHLKTLLDMKGHAGYSDISVTTEYQISAKLAAQTLVTAATLV